jgi:hypothetical protein
MRYNKSQKKNGSIMFIVGKLFYHKGHQDITQRSQRVDY